MVRSDSKYLVVKLSLVDERETPEYTYIENIAHTARNARKLQHVDRVVVTLG